MKIRKTSLLRTTIASLLLLCASTFTASAAEIQSQNLRYSVFYTKHDAGELEIIIDRQGDTVKTSAISHLSTIAKMFLSGQTVETWFKLENNGARVIKGNMLDHKNESVTNGFEIDAKAGLVRFQNKEDEPIQQGDYFESTSFPIVLMASDLGSITGTTVREVNPKKMRYYTYEAPVEENIELNGKTYSTWKVTRNKEGESNRNVTFWLEKSNHVPLKIISSKKGKQTVMTLLNPS